jgi:hypothetical protein
VVREREASRRAIFSGGLEEAAELST